MASFRFPISIAVTSLLVAGFVCTGGCLSTRVNWVDPHYAGPQSQAWTTRHCSFNRVEQRYTQALQLEERGCESCVDLFFEVAMATQHYDGPACDTCRKRRLHKSALIRLVVTGQQFCRLDPRSGLLIRHDGHERTIPITHEGFVWGANRFEKLVPVGDYDTNGIRNLYRRRGVGIPLVVSSHDPLDEPFLVEQAVFPATLQMNVSSAAEGEGCLSHPLDREIRLNLYDPLRTDCTTATERPQPISKDLSAALAYRLRNDSQNILEDFIRSGESAGEGKLRALEPYQPGKVPVVLIHGLLSSPYTWVEMVNELQAYPGFLDDFQIWAFEYPTGQPFLDSAAGLRRQLRASRQVFDPEGKDSKLMEMVLIGHSMGGLLAKLQVTKSGDELWQAVARVPIEQVVVSEEVRQKAIESFYFEPSPSVSRVIFMATPHRGSAFARSCIGRLGSSLVSEPEIRQREHAQLIRNNPGVFRPELEDRIPTSIDLLEPSSLLLKAIARVPVSGRVRMHSVIGSRCCTLKEGRSDGVVPVSSAKERRAITEQIVKATHTRVNKHPDAIREVIAILNVHLQESCQPCTETVTLLDESS
ncbi:MAG: alpha/beta fold hydrolase [Rubripirellula sp.]|nr:alpha/beta fold hydrolase [Rubripirellula sp.]